jgi:hypothetical protein
MMMCKLLLAAALVSTTDAQIMKAMASCGMMASKLDTVCQAHGHKVPTKCASKACANVFLPFYRKCGKLLVAIEHQFPNSAQFSNLYDSCIEMEDDRDTVTGCASSSTKASTRRPSGIFARPPPTTGA